MYFRLIVLCCMRSSHTEKPLLVAYIATSAIVLQASTRVHRLVCVDPETGLCEGIVSLSDLVNWIVLGSP